MWQVNTSNPNKLAEFEKYLGEVKSISQDIKEPDSDPLTVIQYKASQFENVIVDDVALDIEGEDIGVNIKWYLDNLDQFIGKRASFCCYLGIHRDNQIKIFKGECKGSIVSQRGTSFGFNNFFLPDGEKLTFGELIPDHINPRKIALDHLLNNKPIEQRELLKHWSGAFQNE